MVIMMAGYSDVAQVAGVSKTTVGRVVNNFPGVKPEKIELVVNAMKKLGYTPPPVLTRRGPKTPAQQGVHTKRVAYLLIGMGDKEVDYISRPSVMSRKLLEYGMNLLYVPSNSNTVLPDIINPYQIDGIVYQGEEPEGKALKLMQKIPAVRIMTRRNNDRFFDCIAPDNNALGCMAAEYFYAKGIRKIAIICTTSEYCAFKIRIDALKKRSKELNIEVVFSVVEHAKAEDRIQYAENFLANALAYSKNERIGIFIAEVVHALPICYDYWQLDKAIQDKVELLLGDSIDFAPIPRMAQTLSFFDIQPDVLNIRAVDQLLVKMRNQSRNDDSAIDILVKPVLHQR